MTAVTAAAPDIVLTPTTRDAIWVIANPAAGRGSTDDVLGDLRRALRRLGDFRFEQTRASGDEVILANRALDAGARTIVAIGGDGTCGHVADAILRRRSDCAFTVVPTGTGNDFAKTLGLSRRDPDEIARIIGRGAVTRIDAGRVDGHYFLNSCGFGFDASVLEASRQVRFLKGDAVYIYSALVQLFTYRGVDVSLNHIREKQRLLMVTVSNGRYLGGAFKIAPDASVTDGKLDACYVGDCGVLQRGRLFATAMRGTHVGLPMVRTEQVERLVLEFTAAPYMELDGELRQTKSPRVEIECIPAALSVIAAAEARL